MSRSLELQSSAAVAQRRRASRQAVPSWRVLIDGAIAVVWTWHQRRRQRRELLDYLAADSRVAADIGVDPNSARDWADRPFWRR